MSKRRDNHPPVRLMSLTLLSIGLVVAFFASVYVQQADAWSGELVDEMDSKLPLQVVGHGGRIVWDYPVGGNTNNEEEARFIQKTRFNNKTKKLKLSRIDDEGISNIGLGTGSKGHTVAAYEGGCRSLGKSREACGLYLYDFATGKTRRLPVSKSHLGNFQNPSVSGKRVVYNFITTDKKGMMKIRVAWSYLNSSRMNEIKWLTSYIDGAGDLSLKGNQLVFTRSSVKELTKRDPKYGNVETTKMKLEISLTKLSSKKKRVQRLTTARMTEIRRPAEMAEKKRLPYYEQKGTELTSPSIVGNNVYYGRARYGKYYDLNQATTTSRIEKVSIRGGKRTLSSYKSGQIISVAKADRNVFYMQNDLTCDTECPYSSIKGSLFQASDDLFVK